MQDCKDRFIDTKSNFKINRLYRTNQGPNFFRGNFGNRGIVKSSVSMYESLDSKFFRTTLGIQSGTTTSDKSSLDVTILTNSKVKGLSYSFRLVLEGKTSRDITWSSRSEFLEKYSANSFALSYAEDNSSGPLNSEGIADLSFLRTLLAIRQKSRGSGFLEVIVSLFY